MPFNFRLENDMLHTTTPLMAIVLDAGQVQDVILEHWSTPETLPQVLVVDYDSEKELKKQLGVRTQSTLIAYLGRVEKARLASERLPLLDDAHHVAVAALERAA